MFSFWYLDKSKKYFFKIAPPIESFPYFQLREFTGTEFELRWLWSQQLVRVQRAPQKIVEGVETTPRIPQLSNMPVKRKWGYSQSTPCFCCTHGNRCSLAPIYTQGVDSKPRKGPEMWISFCSSVLKGRTTDEDVGSAVNYSGPLPSPSLSSPVEICLGFPRLVPWETKCNSKHDGKEICLLLFMVAGSCLQLFIFFLRFQAEGRGQTDKHPDGCQVFSTWKSHIRGPCPWRRLEHRGGSLTRQFRGQDFALECHPTSRDALL